MTMLLLALLLWTPPHPPAEHAIGSVTLLEGPLKLIRGVSAYRGLEGMNLQHGDILETSADAFAQFEFPSAIVALGPQSRLYILSSGGSSTGHPVSLDLILLSGWLKFESSNSKALYRVRAPLLAATTSGGTVLIRSAASTCEIYVESAGATSLSEISANGDASSSTQAKSSQFFSRQTSEAVSVLAAPSAAFLQAMPRQFRDTLPPRQDLHLDKSVEAKSEHPVSFDEVEPWLKLPFSWRKGLAQRFSPRLSDTNFRKQIESHLREFPEWDPILHPNKTSESP